MRSKYGVRTDKAGIEARTVDGIIFDSKREADEYIHFRGLLRLGAIQSLELQVPFPLFAANAKILQDDGAAYAKRLGRHVYVADFVVTHTDGSRVIYDVKGYPTPLYKLKKHIFEANYGKRIVEI